MIKLVQIPKRITRTWIGTQGDEYTSMSLTVPTDGLETNVEIYYPVPSGEINIQPDFEVLGYTVSGLQVGDTEEYPIIVAMLSDGVKHYMLEMQE